MARVTSNPHCSCNASFHPDDTLQDQCVHLPQVQTSLEHGSVCAVFLLLGALQMQHPGVTPALLRVQLPPIKPLHPSLPSVFHYAHTTSSTR